MKTKASPSDEDYGRGAAQLALPTIKRENADKKKKASRPDETDWDEKLFSAYFWYWCQLGIIKLVDGTVAIH